MPEVLVAVQLSVEVPGRRVVSCPVARQNQTSRGGFESGLVFRDRGRDLTCALIFLGAGKVRDFTPVF